MTDTSLRNPARRGLLHDTLVGACAISLPLGSRWSTAQTGRTSLSRTVLRGGLTQISGAGGNIVALVADGSAALVDTGSGRSPGTPENLIGERASDVGLILNTHWHEDHTGGNDAFGAAGARIIAHENTRLWMSTE
ncbi:MAG: MBL fold metallo-hydrolase, partial [Gammaproteobacteria bacterium]